MGVEGDLSCQGNNRHGIFANRGLKKVFGLTDINGRLEKVAERRDS